MDFNDLSVFRLTEQNIKYLSQRQKVLATNVANADTPGYLPKDVEKPNFSQELKAAQTNLRVTNEKHFVNLPSQASGPKVYTPKTASALNINGNGVDLEDQLNEVSKTSSEHNRMLTIYGKYRDLIRISNSKIGS